ncbi:MAG TPA: metallophosphoesterase family protein [Thermoleophilia bacterium]|nr:metallophosphoesterase family protein [Thermoleophilia bacterium]HQG04171.1 metallophosphoesterase family protein [Thermoleophilia bacterium]HQG55295.1 metallophosphoesterase family protein [Thermoleophilia bacterium]HQJ98701.1 metallophosphoesterase family protein [Thermoleophilia bacterium]
MCRAPENRCRRDQGLHVEEPAIAVISDTHGYYDPKLDELFAGVTHIVHAGDFGTLDVLERLRVIAPLTVVLGNMDRPMFAEQLPWEAEVTVAGVRILVCHIGFSLMGRHDPVAEGYDLVVSGHSHRAAVDWRGDTLFLNPGYAGRPRWGQRRSVALVKVRGTALAPEIVPLD